MGEYTLFTIVAVLGVLAIEFFWLRTGILRTAQYWLSMALVFFFQIWVDGWLTKLSDPIVIYYPDQFSGIRFPFDIPIEDFGFGFAMVTLTLLTWHNLHYYQELMQGLRDAIAGGRLSAFVAEFHAGRAEGDIEPL